MVIPVYNAENSIIELVQRLSVDLYGVDYEVILVNDGSGDKSEEICDDLSARNENVKFISLRKNFGEHNAVLCGLNFSNAEYAVVVDDDLQNPPSEIKKLLNEIEKGYDVVYSKYDEKRHHFLRNVFSSINDTVSTFLMDKPRHLYLSSFKIVRREVVAEIIKYKGPFPYIDGLIIRTTNNIGSVTVKHSERVAGKSNYTPSKLFSLYMNMFVNFSIKPLRVFTITGALIFITGFIMAIYFVISKILYWEVPGWTSTILIILLFSGFQIIFLGLIGEYMGKQYLDQNNTPQWVIKKKTFKT